MPGGDGMRVSSQAELDKALADGVGEILIVSPADVWIELRDTGSATVRAYDSATVRAYDSATAWAYDSATVEAYGSATAWAYDSATAWASDSATAWASDSATVEAYGSATAWAYDSATVRASDSATVEAYDSATVEAYGSATVEAYGSATVEAYGSATVRAYDSATVEAYGSATVQASKYVAVRLHSARVTLDGGVLIDLTQLDLTDPATWCDYHGVTVTDGIAEVFKAVNDQWTTDRGINYQPGSLPTAPDWKPTRECGHGLHFCARPAVSKDQYFPAATRFVRVGVRLDEMVCLGDKIKAPRVVSPCNEVDIHGQVVSA